MSFQVHRHLLREIHLAERCQKAIQGNGKIGNRVNMDAPKSSEAELDSEDLPDLRGS